jgi:hypothetical protein
VRVIENKLQDVPLDVFRSLQAGDLLFIDSSHVLKTGSDVYFLLFEVLPLLRSGTYVHFHDIFHTFDYPADCYLAAKMPLCLKDIGGSLYLLKNSDAQGAARFLS